MVVNVEKQYELGKAQFPEFHTSLPTAEGGNPW